MLDSLYGQVMRLRRRRVERQPQRQRRLARPVISVGNLSMGGTGKTPVVAAIAQYLADAGERPAILSRGYGRADQRDGVVVVSDGGGVASGTPKGVPHDLTATVEQAGDEPLMLARQVPRAAVCVSPDRYLAGTLAERRLGCTVHILDDGFQHIELARNFDVLVTTIGEIPNGRVIPMGRLREPADAAARAHFLVVTDATPGAASAEAWSLGIQASCGVTRTLGEPVPVAASGSGGPTLAATPVLAVAGIAHPDRFVAMLRDAGWNVVDSAAFPDHHRYGVHDLAAIEAKRQASGAEAVFTTDKDAVRIESLPCAFPLYRVPLAVRFDPPDALFASVLAAVR